MKTPVYLLVATLLGVGAYYLLRPAAVEITTQLVEQNPVVETVDEDGVVRSDTEITLAPAVQGKLSRFAVEHGQEVTAGSVIAWLERDDLKAAAAAAQANLETAELAVIEAELRYQVELKTTSAEMQTAESGRQVASANLDRVENGARPQEIRAAEARVLRARVQRDEARTSLERAQKLFEQGYVARSQLDSARTQAVTTRTVYEEANESLRLLQAGARPEEMRVAQSELSRAQAAVQVAEAGQGRVLLALGGVKAARSRLQSAQANLEQAQVAAQEARVVAPESGIVELEQIEPGELVGPTRPLARVVQPENLWVEVLVDEYDRARIRPDQEVKIVCDAYPEEEFVGVLTRIDRQAFLKREIKGTPTQEEDRVFRARVELRDGADKLYPGMSVFAEIVLRRTDPVVTVSRDALITREGEWLAFVAKNGRAEERVLELGLRDASRVEIVSGLEPGERVILAPGRLEHGARVTES